LWLLYVLVVPFCLIVLWGMLLAWVPNFSYQFGIALSLIGVFILFMFLGFSDWYGHNWHITRFTLFMFAGSVIAVFLYCFSAIYLPGSTSYNGTTALFMSANFLFFTALIYLKTGTAGWRGRAARERFIRVELLIEAVA